MLFNDILKKLCLISEEIGEEVYKRNKLEENICDTEKEGTDEKLINSMNTTLILSNEKINNFVDFRKYLLELLIKEKERMEADLEEID